MSVEPATRETAWSPAESSGRSFPTLFPCHRLDIRPQTHKAKRILIRSTALNPPETPVFREGFHARPVTLHNSPQAGGTEFYDNWLLPETGKLCSILA